jgi:hypothetical protein
MVTLGGDLGLVIGGGAGLEMNIILTGSHANEVYFYSYSNSDLGAGVSLGIMAGGIKFNWNSGKYLSLDTFSGWSQGLSAGYGAGSGQLIYAYVDQQTHIPGFNTTDLLYSGFLAGLAKGSASAFASWSYAILLNVQQK